MMRPGMLLGALAVVGVLATSAPVAAQESLASARQLYASADYKGALTMLNALLGTSPSPQDRQAIELYRTFCLVAIGNTDEANKAIESMVSRDPLYRPNMDDVPPRLRTVFSDARKRLLPALIQERYVIAKAAFDRNDYKSASDGFTQVLIGLSDPDITDVAKQSPLADLRVLASGFNDLTVRALAPPPAPVAPAPAPAPVQTPAPAVAAAQVSAATVYTRDDANIVQPVVINQDVPPYPGRVPFDRTGVVDVIIDVTGAVESVTLIESIEPIYNRVLVAAAKNWTYRPARMDGAPVKFKKRIQFTLSRTP
jgi:hypothetical protein